MQPLPREYVLIGHARGSAIALYSGPNPELLRQAYADLISRYPDGGWIQPATVVGVDRVELVKSLDLPSFADIAA